MSVKEDVLALLEGKRGEYISGTCIAEQLHVSRNAVWKSIHELKKDGYKIEAVTNRGYCLCEENDILSVQGMLPYLSHAVISERIYVHKRLESTNKTAKEIAISGAEHGTVIIADCQTAGKGRYGREFHSPPNHGLYISFILHPAQLCFSTPTLITTRAAVVVCESIEAISDKRPLIKWVNDIFIDGKKVCGILTEAVMDFESGGTQWIVVGIGINVSTPTTDFPGDLRETAGSIFPSNNPFAMRNRLAAEIVNRLVAPEEQSSEQEMLETYRQRMFVLGQTVSVLGAGESYGALALTVDDTGRLIVKKENGERIPLSAGEIRIQAK